MDVRDLLPKWEGKSSLRTPIYAKDMVELQEVLLAYIERLEGQILGTTSIVAGEGIVITTGGNTITIASPREDQIRGITEDSSLTSLQVINDTFNSTGITLTTNEVVDKSNIRIHEIIIVSNSAYDGREFMWDSDKWVEIPGTGANQYALKTDLKALEEVVNKIEVRVASNESGIANLEQLIIDLNRRITNNEGSITALDTRVTTLEGLTAGINKGIKDNADAIAENVKDIEQNKKDIAANGLTGVTNRKQIESNTQQISANTQQVGQNKIDIAAHETQINKNTDDISTNKDNIEANKDEIDKLSQIVEGTIDAEDIATVIVASSTVFNVPDVAAPGTSIPYQTVKYVANEKTNPGDDTDKRDIFSLEGGNANSIGDIVVIKNSVDWIQGRRFKTQVHGSITKAANQGASTIIVNLMRQNGFDAAFVEKSDTFTLGDADTFHSYSFSDDAILDDTTDDVRFFVQVIPDGAGISVSIGADMLIEEKVSQSSKVVVSTDKLIAADATAEGGANQAAINVANKNAKDITTRMSGIKTTEGTSLGDIPASSTLPTETLATQNFVEKHIVPNDQISADAVEQASLDALDALVTTGLDTNTIPNPKQSNDDSDDDEFLENEINRFGEDI